MTSSISRRLLSPMLDPTVPQRINAIWGFVGLGIVLAFHLSQLPEKNPVAWTRLTKENRFIWFSLYGLDAILFLRAAYPLLRKKMDGAVFDLDDKILNGIWLSLLGLEVLMVLSVAFQSISRRLVAVPPKQKTT